MALANAVCPKCGTTSVPGALSCLSCATPLDPDATQGLSNPELAADPDATHALSESSQHVATGWTSAADQGTVADDVMAPGSILADRYKIIRMLGEGGMGAVYEAHDRELDRVVALKVIRHEIAENAEILRMFKQELILSRQVTHRNVIRIYDLGLSGGLRFITMQFVEGRDLSTLLKEKGKFTPEEAAAIMVQVCEGLEAAHKEKVVHRDLKPQNIMIDAEGRALVMDFGLAHSTETGTGRGKLLGTPKYMSPEQAGCEEVDARSDLFTAGIVFYELLTGSLPFEAKTLEETLQKRIREQAPAPIELDPSIPKALNDLIVKCMARDRSQRYQSAADIVRDIQIWQGVLIPGNTRLWKRVSLASAVLVVTLAVVSVINILRRPVPAPKPVTVLVGDFNNQTGEPVLDGTLEPSIQVAMEGASFINAYNRGQARREAGKVQPDAKVLSESVARLVAVRDGINVVISGTIAKSGANYTISLKALDPASGDAVARSQVKAPTKEKLLATIPGLTQPIRKALGDRTSVPDTAETREVFTAASLEAAHAYSLGQDALSLTNYDEAIRHYRQAVALDPKMGRAFTGLAVANWNLKHQAESAEYFKQALTLLDRMSERERYRTLGAYYLSVGNYGQAIETFRKLVALYPADAAGYSNLGTAYAWAANMPEAVSACKRAFELSPKNRLRRQNYVVDLMYSSDFEGSVREAERMLNDEPGYTGAYRPLALSTLARNDVKAARGRYLQMEKAGPGGYSLAKMGEADLELYLGRFKEALEPLQAGIAADQQENSPGNMGDKYVALAEARLALGQRAAAAAAASKAVQLSPVESTQYLAARVLLQAGEESKARALAATLENMLQSQTRSYARLIMGEIALRHKRLPEALDAFHEGQKLHDSWISHFLLGRAYIEAGHFGEAVGELETCRKRQGEATDLFFVDTTTIRYLPPLYYWLGRAQEGLFMKEAAQASYQEFLKLRAEADPGDPLAADAKLRSASGR